MSVVVRILCGALILAHGLVHLLYLAPDVAEFSLDRSWLVGEPLRRPLGLALMAGLALSILPILATFLVMQRQFVGGLTSGAVK